MHGMHFLKLLFREAEMKENEFSDNCDDEGSIYFIIDKDLAQKVDKLLVDHEKEQEKKE